MEAWVLPPGDRGELCAGLAASQHHSISASPAEAARGHAGAAALHPSPGRAVAGTSPRGLRGPHLLRSEIKKEEKMGEVEGCVPCGNTSRRVGSHVLLIKSCFSSLASGESGKRRSLSG